MINPEGIIYTFLQRPLVFNYVYRIILARSLDMPALYQKGCVTSCDRMGFCRDNTRESTQK